MEAISGGGAVAQMHLREIRLESGFASPLQLLFTNDGVASGKLTFSLRAGGI